MRISFLTLTLAALTASTAAQNPTNGRVVFEWICAACHGPEAEGNKSYQAPALRIQPDWYLQGEIEKFRTGLRGAHRDDATGASMRLMAAALEDEQIVDVVAYIRTLADRPAADKPIAVHGDVTRGAAIYATCAGCHGADGNGNQALRTPSLAGQWDWYVARQLTKFRAGIRGADPRDAYAAQMVPFAQQLADDGAVRDVAAYIATLAVTKTPPPVADPEAGRQLFAICATCHGAEAQGSPVYRAPHLAGQGTWYVVRQLLNFRRGVRGSAVDNPFGTQMRSVVCNLDDQAMLDLASHVASLPPPWAPPREVEGRTDIGERVYKKTCAPCHGDRGQGNRVLSAPAIAGLADHYLLRQLHDFRAGRRGADRRDPSGRIMRAWAGSLKDEVEVLGVVAFVAGMPPQTADGAASPHVGDRPPVASHTPAGPQPLATAKQTSSMPRGLLSPDRKPPPVVPEPKPVATAPSVDSATPVPENGAVAATTPQPDAADERPLLHATTPGEAIFATCIGCHGMRGEGNATLRAPVIAGLRDFYVIEQLRKFRSGARGSHPADTDGQTMRLMATTLVDDDSIVDIAQFVASLAPLPAAPRTMPGDPDAGATTYGACAACHGPDARGNEQLKAPALVGQADWYLAAQLRNFKASMRGTGDDGVGATMRPMAMTLDDTAIANVVAYIARLGAPPAAATTPAPAAPDAGKAPTPAMDGKTEAKTGGDTEAETEEETEEAAPPEPTGDPERGKALFATCIACHAADGSGNATLKAPAIAGQEPWYLATSLRNFRAGLRGSDPKDTAGLTMRPMSLTLADDQAILDVAAHVASLKYAGATTPTLGGDKVRGQTLYATCAACHGPDAAGMAPLKAPALAGQADWYIVTQLQNFRAGLRGANPQDTAGMLMRPMAMSLPDDQALRDVAAYLASLPRPQKVQ